MGVMTKSVGYTTPAGTKYDCVNSTYACNKKCVAFQNQGKNYAAGECAGEWGNQPFAPWCYTNTTSSTWGLCPDSAFKQVETKKGDLCKFPFDAASSSHTECISKLSGAMSAKGSRSKGSVFRKMVQM